MILPRSLSLLYSLAFIAPSWSFHSFSTNSQTVAKLTTTPLWIMGESQDDGPVECTTTGTTTINRRSVLTKSLGAAAVCIFTPFAAANAAEDPLTPVYFGTGCFWHIQREFVEAERRILGRDDPELTSRTGYAGGTQADRKGRVCYHNMLGAGDYGKMGHGEVVGMTIPDSKISDFAKVYFSLFNPKTGDRVDPGDKGGEYRYLLGLPGGDKHPRFGEVEAAATAGGKRLVAGRGGEPDTYRQGIVYYYDTAKFPFYQAEIYHQFHNDFQSPPYGKKYNDLADLEFTNGGFIKETGCPEGF